MKKIILFFCLIFLLVSCGRKNILEDNISNNTDLNTKKENINEELSGDYKYTLKNDNIERYYLIHIPKSYDKANNVPLILIFHGGGGDSEISSNDSYYNWISKSEKEGFIVAFPNGSSRFRGKLATRNAGNCCAYARDSEADDIGFVKKAIDDIKNKYSIDSNKVFAAGMSNGGMFSYTLACNLTNEFSAIASVAGTDNNDTCSPSKSISVLHIHARNDGHVLFEGGAGPDASNIENETEFVSVDKTIFRWIDNESCNKTPKKVLEVDGAYCEEYSGCSDNTNVKLCVTEEGGHSWPGGKDIPRETSDIPTQAINATDIIWEFFSSNIK